MRVGRVVAREGCSLDVEFPRRQQQTIAVGARIPMAWCDDRRAPPTELPLPDRTGVATERSERGDARRYRLRIDDDDSPERRDGARDRSPPRGRALRVDLRFGTMDFRAEVAAWPGQVIVLRVALETELLLRATDAIELVHRGRPDEPEIRLAGWIERRVLEGLFVRYDFRIDDELGEDAAHQRLRLRQLLAGEAEAESSRPE